MSPTMEDHARWEEIERLFAAALEQPRAARARWISVNVDDVDTLGDHLHATAHGCIDIEVSAPVEEGIRRDVQNPHDEHTR